MGMDQFRVVSAGLDGLVVVCSFLPTVRFPSRDANMGAIATLTFGLAHRLQEIAFAHWPRAENEVETDSADEGDD